MLSSNKNLFRQAANLSYYEKAIKALYDQYELAGPTNHCKGLKHAKDDKGPQIDVLNTAKNDNELEIIP